MASRVPGRPALASLQPKSLIPWDHPFSSFDNRQGAVPSRRCTRSKVLPSSDREVQEAQVIQICRRLGTSLPRSSNDLREAKGIPLLLSHLDQTVPPIFLPRFFLPCPTCIANLVYRAQGRGRGGSLAPREGRLGAAFESPGAPEDEGGHGHRPSRIALSGPLCAGTFLGRLTEVVCGVGVTPRPVVSQVRASVETSPIWFRVGG